MFGLTPTRPRDLVVTVLLTCISVSVVSNATAFGLTMTIVPTPQKMETGAAWAKLTGKPVIAIAADADETVRYGAGMLQRDLKTHFSLDVAIDDSGTAEAQAQPSCLASRANSPPRKRRCRRKPDPASRPSRTPNPA